MLETSILSAGVIKNDIDGQEVIKIFFQAILIDSDLHTHEKSISLMLPKGSLLGKQNLHMRFFPTVPIIFPS